MRQASSNAPPRVLPVPLIWGHPLSLPRVPLSSPILCCSGENQGSDQHEGLSAALGKARSYRPCNSPSPASWPRLSFIIYLSVCPPPESISKGINKFPLGEKPILSWPLWMSAPPKAGLYPFPFRLLQQLICQKTPITSTGTNFHPVQPCSSQQVSNKKTEPRKQEVRINIHDALLLTPRWRAACEC